MPWNQKPVLISIENKVLFRQKLIAAINVSNQTTRRVIDNLGNFKTLITFISAGKI